MQQNAWPAPFPGSPKIGCTSRTDNSLADDVFDDGDLQLPSDGASSLQYAGASWDELKYIRQAVGFLVIHQKPKKSLDEITHDLCPILSVQQLYRISTMYWDDKYGTHSVAPEVSAQRNHVCFNSCQHPSLLFEALASLELNICLLVARVALLSMLHCGVVLVKSAMC
jgi:hypothetical protein